jgi:hypothetical protein
MKALRQDLYDPDYPSQPYLEDIADDHAAALIGVVVIAAAFVLGVLVGAVAW